MNTSETLRAVDTKMLYYLSPATDKELLRYGADSYFCGCSKHLKNEYKDSCIEKVQNWVERNGGRFEILSDRIRRCSKVHKDNRIYSEDRDGQFVRIVFPGYNKRNMKEIMSLLYL